MPMPATPAKAFVYRLGQSSRLKLRHCMAKPPSAGGVIATDHSPEDPFGRRGRRPVGPARRRVIRPPGSFRDRLETGCPAERVRVVSADLSDEEIQTDREGDQCPPVDPTEEHQFSPNMS